MPDDPFEDPPGPAEEVAPGPRATDEQLLAWSRAATAGGLPTPTRARWQMLRGGVVNLWEFDAAEYWMADGRAQLVGTNQTGKSTLMALTTLIMLAGDLDRQYVDTFGEQHKSFRYYVEPTDDPTDRRETASNSLNRGWAWVEYGRVGPYGPEFYTTLLFAQARRGVKDMTRTWAICDGPERVRDGLTLLDGQAVALPTQLEEFAPGFTTVANGTAYRKQIAEELFGVKVGRLDSVIRMLKVLRTPNLGTQLNPDWFTLRMREALPGVDPDEVRGLAEGWDELEQLAADRDSAEAAREAVTAYVTRAWGPWADAVLRSGGDELVATNTRFDGVTRGVRDAETKLATAEEALSILERKLDSASTEQTKTQAALEELLRSSAYRQAHTATERVEQLDRAVGERAREVTAREVELVAAQAEAEASKQALGQHDDEVERLDADRVSAAQLTAQDVTAARLAPEAPGWVAAGDTDRLTAAVTTRQGHLSRMRALTRTAELKGRDAEAAAKQRDDAGTALRDRKTQHAAAARRLDEATQALSDGLELWAVALGDVAPTTTERAAWLDAVHETVRRGRPRETLLERLRIDWLATQVNPLTGQIAVATQHASTMRADAHRLEAAAAVRLAETEPVPPAPPGWVRRARPAASDGGAPLWRLLDPTTDLSDEHLARLEAAMGAAGLLDAWVTPDGVWLPERDGTDAVLSLTAPVRGVDGSRRLGEVLVPSGDFTALHTQAARLLRAVTLDAVGHDSRAELSVSLDGRYRTPTTTGRAEPDGAGAALLGTAARFAARAREVARLRAEAAELAHEAEQLDADIASMRDQISVLNTAASSCPGDRRVVRAAVEVITAAKEADTAADLHARRSRAADDAESKAADARAAQLMWAGDHDLPTDALDDVEQTLNAVSKSIFHLALTISTFVVAVAQRDGSRDRVVAAELFAGRRRAEHERAVETAEAAVEKAQTARDTLGATEQELLHRAEALDRRRTELRRLVKELEGHRSDLDRKVASAGEQLGQAGERRTAAEHDRELALLAWWAPVDAGLADARNLPDAGARTLTQALNQAQVARRDLRPNSWPAPDAPEAASQRASRTLAAWNRAIGAPLTELRTILESSRGRSVALLDPDDNRGVPGVVLIVDATGDQVPPAAATARLGLLVQQLGERHDEKMQKVLVELLSSTFVDHLRECLGDVIELLDGVNTQLAAHPTGANRTTLRLRRTPADGQRAGYDVLRQLEKDFIDSPEIHLQVRSFLEQQIRLAQEQGRSSGSEWIEFLAEALDFRRWFDVVTDYRVGDGTFHPLTREVHGQDSGGGKVVTLLQPLLATIVALYDASDTAPRPLWLDEAFTGVDKPNQSSMLDLLVDFELDFLLAGPSQLVAAAQVPSAAVWYVSRAPAPDEGVDLSLSLWAGRRLTEVRVPADRWPEKRRRPAPAGQDQTDLFTDDDPDETAGAGAPA